MGIYLLYSNKNSKMSRLLIVCLLACLLGLALGAPRRNPLQAMGNAFQNTANTVMRHFQPLMNAGRNALLPVTNVMNGMFGGVMRLGDNMMNGFRGMLRI